MWWNAVKSCQISPIYLSFHHKLMAITSLPHPTAKHEARQCTSLKPSRSSTKPSRSSMTCYQLIMMQTHEVLKGDDWWELCFFDLLWFWPEGRKLRYYTSCHIIANQHCKSWVVKIWNCQIWWSGDLQADLGFQKFFLIFSTPTCHDRSTPNGSSAGSWWQASQSFQTSLQLLRITHPIGLHIGIHLSQKKARPFPFWKKKLSIKVKHN